MSRRKWSVACAIVAIGLTCNASAAVNRILLVGDSWAAIMLGVGSFAHPLADAGLSQCGVVGAETAIGGTTARQFAQNWPIFGTGGCDRITLALNTYPTADIVHVSLGGNDILGRLTGTMTPAEQAALFDEVTGYLRTVILHIKSIRPNARVAVCGYDYIDRPLPNLTAQETNQKIVDFSQRVLAMTQSIDDCSYIHNLGLMQHRFGYPGVYQAGQTPFPGGAPAYAPFPGGDIAYTSPPEALSDPIHLSIEGYERLAENCVQQCYAAWLTDCPEVVETAPMGLPATSGDVVSFAVAFSRPVTGVDIDDFNVAVSGAVTGCSIVRVEGSGAHYVVSIHRGSGNGTISLSVVDDDSIVDIYGVPLGGYGIDNGGSSPSAPIVIDESISLPLPAWPIAAALGCVGFAASTMQRRKTALPKR